MDAVIVLEAVVPSNPIAPAFCAILIVYDDIVSREPPAAAPVGVAQVTTIYVFVEVVVSKERVGAVGIVS